MQHPLGRYRDPIFFASGFAALIYESIWTHYLKLFLGHAAYAQTLVLAIFMGGMAIGAAAVGRRSDRVASPLRIYAYVEAAIGVFALVFHPVFAFTTQGFYDLGYGAHWGSAGFQAAKWALAALLVLPQSILLGATFPLFASAATRAAPAIEGRSIATLYFANSLGGALGVVVSGFVLVPSLGLFGTIAIAGVANLAIAAIVLGLSNKAATDHGPPSSLRPPTLKRDAEPIPDSGPAPVEPGRFVWGLILSMSFFTGASSFIYEIGWIRMLSLVLGSASHSFELMLSSFILGLALGGFWIRKRLDRGSNHGILLGRVQVAMGCAALATVPLYSVSFDVVAWAVGALPKTDGGYAAFNLVRYGIASLIMFPAAFCAGMTLPIATVMLHARHRAGERAIGFVYSMNTVGSIAGLAFAIHIGLPAFGLEYLVGYGAVIDVLLGAMLLAVFGSRSHWAFAGAAALASVVGLFVVAQTFDPQKFASGVFRIGRASTSGTVLEVAHGKTATITVELVGPHAHDQAGSLPPEGAQFVPRDGPSARMTRGKHQGLVSLKTNGKPDAAANLDPAGLFTPDQLTTALLGAFPLMIHDAPNNVANIGFGAGLTSEIILADSRVRHLDTVEIEPRVVALAKHFLPLNKNVYTDPRSTIRIDDAKSFFAVNGETYDVIVSEPSNPWVSGISGLFSIEFYKHVSRYLKDDGLFVQWLQAYETHPDRVVSVLKAMDQAFDDYMVVVVNEIDVLLVGKPRGAVAMPADAYARLSRRMKEALRKVDIASQGDVVIRIAGNKALYHPWLEARAIAANSDFVPYLDAHADRDRFLNRWWKEFADVALSPIPIAEILGGRPPLPTPSALTITPQFGPDPQWLAARMLWEKYYGPMRAANAFNLPINLPPNLAGEAQALLDGCATALSADKVSAIARFATRVLPYLSPAEERDVLGSLRGAACFDGLAGSQEQWPALLRAIADRNAEEFGRIADDLLVASPNVAALHRRYLLGMAMLGRIRAGKRERAAELWTQFGQQAPGDEAPGLVLNLLYTHALRPKGVQ